MQFTNQSTGGDKFAWDFGDGNSSGEKAPLHNYSIPGPYTVTLTVTGDGGAQKESKEQFVTVNEGTWLGDVVSVDPSAHSSLGGSTTLQVSTIEWEPAQIAPITFQVISPDGPATPVEADSCGVTEQPQTDPPSTIRCWQTEVTLPANDTSDDREYSFIASSVQIADTRSGAAVVACGFDGGLLENGSFCEGLSGWSISVGTPGNRAVMTLDSDFPFFHVVEVSSEGAGAGGSNSKATQDLNIDVANALSVVIEGDVKAISASVAQGCGFLGQEFPVGIYVSYLNSLGEPHQIRYGFYFGGGSCANPTQNGPEDPIISVAVPQGEWFHFTSDDLLGLVPDLATLTRVIVEGNGWDYVGRADNLKLTASSMAQLTDDPASDFQPSFSPDGSQIVFVSDRDGDPEIFIMNADGSDQTQLTFNNVRDAYPSFSPDGARILFERSLPSGTQCFPCPIISMNPDGSDEVVLRETLGAGATPRYSPEGGTVLFSDFDWGASANKLFRMAADGSGVEQLTFLTSGGESRFDGRPVLTPDGSRVVFVSNRDSDADTEIFIMNSDGSNIIQLTLNTASDHEPEVSPDGGVIAFSSDREAGDSDIYRMKLDGSGPEVLVATAGNDNHPRYSPDGARLVFASTLAGNRDIFVVPVDAPPGIPTPNAAFTASPTTGDAPLTVTFTDTSSGLPDTWSWDFGDGASSTEQNPSHTYQAPGTYTVSLTVTNTSGSSAMSMENLVTVTDSAWTAWENEVVTADPVTLSADGGTVTVRISTQEGVDATVDSVSFATTGPEGFNQIESGTSCAVAPHPEADPPYTSRCWQAQFSLPANTIASNQIYSVTATSSQVEGERFGSVGVLSPSLSTLGSIAFASGDETARDIHSIRADGTGRTDLTNNTDIDDVFPNWNWGGNKIAFNSNRPCAAPGNCAPHDLWFMDPDGSNLTRCTSSSIWEYRPSWSPDGTQMVWERSTTPNSIWVMDADCSNQQELINSPGHDGSPDWSPDGSRIVFHSNRDGDQEICIANADGSNQDCHLTDNDVRDASPVWSPDGSQILFVSERDGNAEIYVMDADGANQVNLTNSPAEEGNPTWSPDGSKIAFHTNRDGNYEIYLMEADGSNPVNLTGTPDDDQYPSWQPVAPPVLVGSAFYGGSGNQIATDIAISGTSIYVTGIESGTGVLLRYQTSLGAPVWDLVLPEHRLWGVAVADGTVVTTGDAKPPNCGASDGKGDIEFKSTLYIHADDGTLSNCESANFFSYRGYERYKNVIAVTEGSAEALYTSGAGELFGFGGIRTILAKYDEDGSLVWKKQYGSGSNNGSDSPGLTWHKGFLYLAGRDQDSNIMLLKYDAAAQPPDADPDADGAGELVPVWVRPSAPLTGQFQAVTASGDAIYAAGYSGLPGEEDYLIQKYDESGNLLWSQNWGGAGTDMLNDIVEVNGRLFVVGYTANGEHGADDAVVMEIDPNNGSVVSEEFFGGAEVDRANAAATDGVDLYVVGYSRSFASAQGNSVGEDDILVLKYALGTP